MLMSEGMLKTKCVCTIGPASASKEVLKQLLEGGMAIARLNLAHCTQEFAAQVIQDLREIQKGSKRSEIAIWIDVNGPKVRTGKLEHPVALKKGDDFFFVNELEMMGDNTKVTANLI
jgi:pyruvate kinase